MFNKLTSQIFIAIIVGIVVGFLANISAESSSLVLFKYGVDWIQPIGQIFIRLLKMVIIPLVFASIVMGIVNLGDIQHLGKVGLRTVLYFCFFYRNSRMYWTGYRVCFFI